MGGQAPLEAVFREGHSEVPLTRLLGPNPTILVLGYSRCPQLCSEVMGGLVDALKMIDLKLDNGYGQCSVSASIRETRPRHPGGARDTPGSLARGRQAGDQSLVLKPNLKKLCASVGFKFARDPVSKQFAHAAGCVGPFPEGQSRNIFTNRFLPSELRQSILGKIAPNAPTLRELCCFASNTIRSNSHCRADSPDSPRLAVYLRGRPGVFGRLHGSNKEQKHRAGREQ